MSSVNAGEFEQFFFDLHGHDPFPWQTRLAAQVCSAGWPKVIDLPTASGKTACIDIALFALAVLGDKAPRRILFIVDRRIIVSEAHDRAKRIANALASSPSIIVRKVADALKRLAQSEQALDTYELRGGAFRDERWLRTPLQPTVIASTVDQVGSRLLFRGYGISEHTWPMHAGLIANDVILFLDEAHCSKAFAQTLQAVELYRGPVWAREPLNRPFHFVEMTATPERTFEREDRFQIDEDDLQHDLLAKRIFATKPVILPEPIACKKDDLDKFAASLIAQANSLADEVDARRVSIMVNRVSTAKRVHQLLCAAKREALLVIGRMRPLDRDSLLEKWAPLKSGVPRKADDKRTFVVSTQCLEVGADLDFDVLVSECAGIDALQQRFGRLDRLGDFTRARGAILATSWQLGGKHGDPVYGDALPQTWEFLNSIARERTVDMGIASLGGDSTVAEHVCKLSQDERSKLILKGEDGPLLLPAHVDALVQTSPRPEPEPFIDYFLHGPKRGTPDVYVVWRSDLESVSPEGWAEIVSLCPPVSSEAMPVPLWVFRNWFNGQAVKDESDTDVNARLFDEEAESGSGVAVLVWRGVDQTVLATHASQFSPGDTVVLPSSGAAWSIFGFKPADCPADRGDEARMLLRRRLCLRLHPAVLQEWTACPSRDHLLNLVSAEEANEEDIQSELAAYPSEFRPSALKEIWELLSERGSFSRYPIGPGWFVESYWNQSPLSRGRQVSLQDHLDHVERAADLVTGDLLALPLKQAVMTAGRYHDYGKADERYQSWLRNGDALAARFAPRPIAKSGKTMLRKQSDCGLPDNFRHESLSLLFAAKDANIELRDLTLHLIASHHGRCRPFAPVELDKQAGCVSFGGVSVCRTERIVGPAHALSSGVADRFWKLTRQYGWWGLAYLEAMLRLADWQASDEEQGEVSD